MSDLPQKIMSASGQDIPGAAASGIKSRHKNGDGGFWSAVAAFILLLIFLALRSDTAKSFLLISQHTKESLLGAALLLDIHAFFRKIRLKSHDYSYRQYVTNFLIWITLIFVIPGLIFYLFLV